MHGTACSVNLSPVATIARCLIFLCHLCLPGIEHSLAQRNDRPSRAKEAKTASHASRGGRRWVLELRIGSGDHVGRVRLASLFYCFQSARGREGGSGVVGQREGGAHSDELLQVRKADLGLPDESHAGELACTSDEEEKVRRGSERLLERCVEEVRRVRELGKQPRQWHVYDNACAAPPPELTTLSVTQTGSASRTFSSSMSPSSQ